MIRYIHKNEKTIKIKSEVDIMKLKGLKKAVGDYKRYNNGGVYDPHYSNLMFNVKTGELWNDEFYDLGHNSYVQYNDKNIINLSAIMESEVTMNNIKDFIQNDIDLYLN
jgi:hypothetical protein